MSDALDSAAAQQNEEQQPAKNDEEDPLFNAMRMNAFQGGEEEKKDESLFAAASSADETFLAEQVAEEPPPPADELLEHLFQPGDHVIRWEMLPIAWPIQIHGIVLETTDNSVTLADFGLTAKPIDEHSTDLKDTPVQPFIDHPVSEKIEQAVVSAWEKFRPKQDTKQRRQRITVQTITDPKEMSRWKKVNYGGNLFGRGSEDDESENKSAAPGNRTGAWLKKMTSSWNSNDDLAPRTPERKKDGDLSNSERTEEVDATLQIPSAMSTVVSDEQPQPKTWLNRMTSWKKSDGAPLSPEKKLENIDDSAIPEFSELNKEPVDPPEAWANEEQADGKAWWRRMSNWNCDRSLVGYAETPEKKQSRAAVDDNTADSEEANWSQRKMNPAMAKLIAEKNEVPKPLEKVSNETCKQGKVLPKADPPKLILARTRFLLEHGESILPAYVRSPFLTIHKRPNCAFKSLTTLSLSCL